MAMLIAVPAFAMTSANYSLAGGGINAGGGTRSSAGYTMTADSIGIGGEGESSSAQYVLLGGGVPATTDLDSPDTVLTTQPSNPSSSRSATFEFTSTEISLFQCRIDDAGFDACESPLTLTSLGDGTHTFQVQSIDLFGNSDATPAAYVWTIDATAPDTIILAGPSGLTSETSASFSFSSEAGASFECRLNSDEYTACSSPKSYTGKIDGTYTFEVRALDALGNADTTPASRVWAVDATGPVLALSALLDGAVTNNPTLNVSGTVADNEGIQSLVIGGQTITIQPDNSFSCVLLLSAGTNTVLTVATDLAGNTTSDTRVITLDQNAPGLAIASPADNSITNQPLSIITGTVDENSTVSVSLNSGTPQAVLMSGTTYTATVHLIIGVNTIAVTATDLPGNTNTLKRTVTYGTLAPSLAVTVPSQDMLVTKATLTIGGTVSDDLGAVSVVITTGTATYAPAITTGNFSQTITLPAEGAYNIIVTATDTAGNASTVTRNVIYTMLGDLDADGDVDVVDALKALRIAAGLDTPTASEQSRGDVAPIVNNTPTPDNKIDIGDVVVILRKAVGLGSW